MSLFFLKAVHTTPLPFLKSSSGGKNMLTGIDSCVNPLLYVFCSYVIQNIKLIIFFLDYQINETQIHIQIHAWFSLVRTLLPRCIRV
jgi:hypothetical protein